MYIYIYINGTLMSMDRDEFILMLNQPMLANMFLKYQLANNWLPVVLDYRIY